jgi:hypothetical protein
MTQAASVGNPNHRLYAGFEAFKQRRHPRLACVIRDPTYGTMQVYLLSVPTTSAATTSSNTWPP